MGTPRRRCCCATSPAPPDSCVCTACASAYLANFSARLRYEHTGSGVFWEWRYASASAVLAGASCSWWQDEAGSGTMTWEVDAFDPSDACTGEPTVGSCDVSTWDPSIPLIALSCGVTSLFPGYSSVTTPTLWSVSIEPMQRYHPFDAGYECECNPLWTSGGLAYKPAYGLSLIYDRAVDCPTTLGVLRHIGAFTADGLSLLILGGAGTYTDGPWEITVSGGASLA
jgi:hypothetical protein